jgi:pSer/pThr/pTyr-binding forkhead associated (FHA) protein
VTDLHSRNGTLLNFERLAPGETRDLRTGDVLTIGRSRLVFRDGA